MKFAFRPVLGAIATMVLVSSSSVLANDFRAKGMAVRVAGSALSVVPPRDWNKLSIRPGKYAETWTLDGEQLNDVTFYAGVQPGSALIREASKKRDPLPKFTESTLLAEVPELLEGTYRTVKKIGAFKLVRAAPERFLGHDGVQFAYEYTDSDDLPRKGEARATLIEGKLYMATFDAPRLHYFDEAIGDFTALMDSATLAS